MSERMYFGYYRTVRQFFQRGPSNWWPREKALLVICGLEIYFVVALLSLATKSLGLSASLPSNKLIFAALMVLAILGFNYWFLCDKDRERAYTQYFDKLSERKVRQQRIASILTTLFIVVLTVSLFYLTGRDSDA